MGLEESRYFIQEDVGYIEVCVVTLRTDCFALFPFDLNFRTALNSAGVCTNYVIQV